jgi:hypothetical protein
VDWGNRLKYEPAGVRLFHRESTHLRRARNYISENKFSRVDFLARCHRHCSPYCRRQQDFDTLKLTNEKAHPYRWALSLVSPTGLGWNTLHESIAELDRKLEELGLEVNSND